MDHTNAVFDFDGSVTEETLRAYLSRAVTLTTDPHDWPKEPHNEHIKEFILDTGAKYICRFGCIWDPSQKDLDTYPEQKKFIEDMHASDPHIVFEGCLFEHVTEAVESLKVPKEAFEAFGLSYEDRCFRYADMLHPSGDGKDFWSPGHSVPDITRTETQLFFYARACAYIDIGYEAFHMGQVYLMGRHDKDSGYACYTRLTQLIRAYAASHARRHFVFLNAHIHGIIGTDGMLLLDFHMWPGRYHSDDPTSDWPQPASIRKGRVDSIYGRSLGGLTHSGWTCEHLPYLIELDNWGNDPKQFGTRNDADITVWGYDEISWFANQTDEYRHLFLTKIPDELADADSEGYFAMPGQRIAYIHSKNDTKAVSYTYFAYDKRLKKEGFGDQSVIKAVWKNRPIGR